MPTRRLLFAALGAVATAAGCGYYSFTGASIPEHLQTVAIPLVEDNTASPFTTMDQDLTQRLLDRFVGQTRLRLEPEEADADAVLNVRIVQYQNQPAAVTGEERAAVNRVTITVSARYTDRVEDEDVFDRTFRAFGEYDPVADPSGEEEAVRLALDDLADDIFSEATSNW